MAVVKHTTRQCKNLIGGKWVHAHSRQTFEDRNPAKTSDLVGVFPASGTKDVADAVAAAKEAFQTWRLVPAPKRAEILFRAGELLTERKELYAHDMTREMGKSSRKPAATCRRPSTRRITWLEKAAVCSATLHLRSCRANSP